MRYFAPIFAMLLLGAAASPAPASAQPYRARQGVQNGEVRSLDEIMNGIRRERPGSLAIVWYGATAADSDHIRPAEFPSAT